MRALKIFFSSLIACWGACLVTCSVAWAVLFGWRHLGISLAEVTIAGGFLGASGTLIVAPIALAARRPKRAIVISATIVAVIAGIRFFYWCAFETGK